MRVSSVLGCVKGNRGRGAYGKTVVFGLFERQGKVDGWRGYNGLVDLGYGHFRVDHSRDEFARGSVHIKGIPKHTFHLHLKETEWRYNQRRGDIYKTLLKYLGNNPLSQA